MVAMSDGDSNRPMPSGLSAKTVHAVCAQPEAVALLLGFSPGRAAVRLPRLTVTSAHRYIAAIAAEVGRGLLDRRDANTLLYAAQMLLTVARFHLEAHGTAEARTPLTLPAVTGSALSELEALLDQL